MFILRFLIVLRLSSIASSSYVGNCQLQTNSVRRLAISSDTLVAKSTTHLTESSTKILQKAPAHSPSVSSTDYLSKQAAAKKVIKLALLYEHLPKAGGSFIRSTIDPVWNYHLDKVIAPEHVRILSEFEGLTEEDRRNTFTVGSVRNPCDYYVSHWAWDTRVQAWKDPRVQTPAEYYGLSEELNTTEDQRRFGEWLRWLMPDATPPGLLTARMLESYFTESVANATEKLGSTVYNDSWPEADRHIYVAAARSLDPSAVDCWIKTESLTSDFRTCLTLFEQQAGSNIVNWTAFDTLLALREQQHQETMVNGEGDEVQWSDGNWSTKNSGHQKCKFYFDYGDDRLKGYVYKADYAIFDKFGYQSCCSSDDALSL